MTDAVTLDLCDPRPADRRGETYEQLIARTKEVPAVPTVAVRSCDGASLEGAVDAAKAEIVPTAEERMIATHTLQIIKPNAAAKPMIGCRASLERG